MDIAFPWVRGTQVEKSWKFQWILEGEQCEAAWGGLNQKTKPLWEYGYFLELHVFIECSKSCIV